VYERLERERFEARHAALAAERKTRELARLRAEHAGLRLDLALIRLQRLLARKYRPDQPRVPAGEPGAGQWTNGTFGLPAISGGQSEVNNNPDARIILAGGFTEDQLGMTAQGFASKYCIGSIQGEIPGQFKGSTISEVMAAAKSGDADARKCLKLLSRDKYRK
jgi:hypothetical protein